MLNNHLLTSKLANTQTNVLLFLPKHRSEQSLLPWHNHHNLCYQSSCLLSFRMDGGSGHFLCVYSLLNTIQYVWCTNVKHGKLYWFIQQVKILCKSTAIILCGSSFTKKCCVQCVDELSMHILWKTDKINNHWFSLNRFSQISKWINSIILDVVGLNNTLLPKCDIVQGVYNRTPWF